MTTRPRTLASVLLVTLLAACAPIVSENAPRPVVALINAPAGERVSFLADRVEEEMLELPDCCDFTFMRSAPIRFQETHRDMFGSRAVPQAASLARNLTSDLAVLVSAPLFERREGEADGGIRITGRVRASATVVDAATEEVLGSVGSLEFSGSRFHPDDTELPDPQDDPLMRELAAEAAVDLAPHLASLLREVGPAYRK